MHPVKYYDGPELPREQEGWIQKWNSFDHTGNRLSYDWISQVISVDGRPIQKASWARLLPGEHTVKMVCEVHPRMQKIYHARVREFSFKVEANHRYYAWCSLNATLVAGGGSGILAIPGTTVGDVREGDAIPFLDTRKVP